MARKPSAIARQTAESIRDYYEIVKGLPRADAERASKTFISRM